MRLWIFKWKTFQDHVELVMLFVRYWLPTAFDIRDKVSLLDNSRIELECLQCSHSKHGQKT
jgi:hypothetical protein